jgi:GNAT superfamily N-acetyltransferase
MLRRLRDSCREIIEVFLIRPYDRALDSVEAINEMLHLAYKPLLDRGWRYVAAWQDAARAGRRINEGTFLIGFEDGVMAGGILYKNQHQTKGCPHYDKPGTAMFGMFGVHPDFKGKGYGKALHDAVEQLAIHDGVEELACDTAVPADFLQRMYESWGYRFIEYAQWDLSLVNYQSVILSKSLKA